VKFRNTNRANEGSLANTTISSKGRTRQGTSAEATRISKPLRNLQKSTNIRKNRTHLRYLCRDRKKTSRCLRRSSSISLRSTSSVFSTAVFPIGVSTALHGYHRLLPYENPCSLTPTLFPYPPEKTLFYANLFFFLSLITLFFLFICCFLFYL